MKGFIENAYLLPKPITQVSTPVMNFKGGVSGVDEMMFKTSLHSENQRVHVVNCTLPPIR